MEEVEVKFKVDDFTPIRQQLIKLGAKKIGQAIQKTTLFDFPDGSLRRQDKTLRLRTGFKNELTFKHKKSRTARFKSSQEMETEIKDPDKVAEIFHHLGLKPSLIFEKTRQSWQLDGVKIELDELPFAKYVELEGAPQKSRSLAPKLGLDFNQGVSISYPKLFREWYLKQGIKPASPTPK